MRILTPRQFELFQWILEQDQPFSLLYMEKQTGAARETIYKAMEGFTSELKFYKKHAGNGNFRTVMFPIWYTDTMCYEYMNSQCISGKSRAKLHRRNVNAD